MKRFYIQPHTYESAPQIVIHQSCRHCGHVEIETHTFDKKSAMYYLRVIADWLYFDKVADDHQPSTFGDARDNSALGHTSATSRLQYTHHTPGHN
jgi:hypothetical protein